jgi:TolA-binding protein
MNEETGHIDLFERFRNNELSESELRAFEAKLVYDSEFNQAFIEFQSVEEGIKTHYRNELKLKLQEVDKKMDAAPPKSRTLRLVMWSSSVAAAILIGVFIFQHFSTPNNIAIAQQYWPYEEGLPVKMSTKGKYDDAMNAFKLGEFDKAYTLLEPMDSDTSDYFLGVISFENQDFKKAAQYFWQVENNSKYYHQAQFRLALVSMINGDLDLTKLILQALIEHQTEFAESSKEILEKI